MGEQALRRQVGFTPASGKPDNVFQALLLTERKATTARGDQAAPQQEYLLGSSDVLNALGSYVPATAE